MIEVFCLSQGHRSRTFDHHITSSDALRLRYSRLLAARLINDCRLSNVQKRAGVFYRVKTTRYDRVVSRPDKARAASFLNGFKNIPGKECVNRVDNNYAFVNVGN